MDKLWAPWRIKYIRKKKQDKCIFCQSLKSSDKHYVVYRTDYSISMLNIFPYNNGHMLIFPIRHIGDLTQLKEVEVLDLFRVLLNTKKLLNRVLKPDGYNIGINLSKIAGAGITDHLHIHIVPRWQGDTNFMPVLCDTKIISQSLDELFKQLKYAKSKYDLLSQGRY
ncbi:MAG: HIT domain-containing protein [Candidatus Omnitrophica bacterium]|nr:HIT domain-containing protein [Candidatus Omnitrophota bacterium]